SVSVGPGTLIVCTLNLFAKDPCAEALAHELLSSPEQFHTECAIAPEKLQEYLASVKKRGPRREDTMNHFWEIDNKLVEDKLFWEEAQLDLRKIN
ncbi:MAG: hypothetical protein IJJ33_12165, partial [Victivallales bacterium]|nr:hypothetical protein [Victivallales bacterium]